MCNRYIFSPTFLAGVEPATHAIEAHSSIQLSYRNFLIAGGGIEPPRSDYETDDLPLIYPAIVTLYAVMYLFQPQSLNLCRNFSLLFCSTGASSSSSHERTLPFSGFTCTNDCCALLLTS